MARVQKGVLTQGTNVYIKHGETGAFVLTKMVCIKGIQLGDDNPSDIDDTCLEEENVKTSTFGLSTPGDGSITINTDPDNATHLTLLQLAEERALVEVFVGWSGSKTPPTMAVDGVVTLPPDRTWTSFQTLLKDTAPTFEPDSLVGHSVPMKRQTRAITAYKITP